VTAANSIQMLLSNLDCDGTQLHAPLPPLVAYELLIKHYALFRSFQSPCLLSWLYVIYTASVARHIYLTPSAGVGALQKIYGGKP